MTEIARAKVNLTLHVGRIISDGRYKGYHPIDSLVVFADFGDWLTFEKREKWSATYTGPFSDAFISEMSANSVHRALELCGQPDMSFTLDKQIPIAAGLGGGTADAAAVLRQFDPHGKVYATKIGADGPVCRLSKTALMQGIGGRVTAFPNLGQIPAVLVNPLKAVSTGSIFKAFDSQTNDVDPMPNAAMGRLLERALFGKNDLQPTAVALEPSIGDIIDALQATPNCALARMSGSGATCVGLYETSEAAKHAAKRIQSHHPDWWVRACKLGDPA